jgi:hypothetical protein
MGSRLALVVGLALLSACGEEARVAKRGQPIAAVGDQVLDARVVEMIASRDGITEAEARTQALDTLRLAQAWLDDHGGEHQLDPDRETHLLASARARLWLREVFEPANGPETISDKAMTMARRSKEQTFQVSHGRVHEICQVVVNPGGGEADGVEGVPIPPDTEEWRRGAQAYADKRFEAIRGWGSDLAKEKGCALMGQLLRAMKDDEDEYNLRFETGGFDLQSQAWVKEFREALLAVDRPGTFVPPFHTKFGYHLVWIAEIHEALRPPGETPESEIEEALREHVLTRWRAQKALPDALTELRRKHVARLAQPGAPAPPPAP